MRSSKYLRLEFGRRRDLDEFDIIRTANLIVHDSRRLQAAISRFEGDLTPSFISELDPAFEHIEHLEIAKVLMQTGRMQIVIAGRILLNPDHMDAELPVRCPKASVAPS